MQMRNDAVGERAVRAPWWFRVSAALMPAGTLAQFLLAGQALFHDSDFWGLHGALGGSLSIPSATLLVGALCRRRLRHFAWGATLVFVFYALQVALAAGRLPMALSLHPFNAGLLLIASLLLLTKIEGQATRAAVKASALSSASKMLGTVP